MKRERFEELRQLAGAVDGQKSEWMDELISEVDRLKAEVEFQAGLYRDASAARDKHYRALQDAKLQVHAAREALTAIAGACALSQEASFISIGEVARNGLNSIRDSSEARLCDAERWGGGRCGLPIPCKHHKLKCDGCGEPEHYGGEPGKSCGMPWPG